MYRAAALLSMGRRGRERGGVLVRYLGRKAELDGIGVSTVQ